MFAQRSRQAECGSLTRNRIASSIVRRRQVSRARTLIVGPGAATAAPLAGCIYMRFPKVNDDDEEEPYIASPRVAVRDSRATLRRALVIYIMQPALPGDLNYIFCSAHLGTAHLGTRRLFSYRSTHSLGSPTREDHRCNRKDRFLSLFLDQ